MKHLTYLDRSVLVDDEAADLVVRYAVALANAGHADAVGLRGFGADGDEVVVTLVLNPGTELMAEVTHTTMSEPDNHEAVAYMRERLALMESPPNSQPLDAETEGHYSDSDLR